MSTYTRIETMRVMTETSVDQRRTVLGRKLGSPDRVAEGT